MPDVPDGHPLAGQLVVFTGKLTSLGRKDARALVSSLGATTADEVNAKTTMLVVGAEGFATGTARREGDGDDGQEGNAKSSKVKRAEALNAERAVRAQGEARIEILDEEAFCKLVGLSSPQTLKQQFYTQRDLLGMYTALREDHLRYLQKWGLIQPVRRTNAETYYGFPDLGIIKQAHAEMAQGAAFRTVLKSLIASRQGQLAFDFRLEAEPARIIRLRRHTSEADSSVAAPVAPRAIDTAMAEQYFLTASMLDEGDDPRLDEAAAAYRKALELDPTLVAALINLANIYYSRHELAEAQALYERAIALEGDFFEAHFNLGNIYHDLGRFEEALGCYREALRLNPTFADTHFYLAVVFEKMGLSQEARPHWRAYRQLAPHGEWVELAREFSE